MTGYDLAASFENAELVVDPLADLVERAKVDPGAPFEPYMLTELAALGKADRARFEKMRAALKKAGVRVATLDEALAKDTGDSGKGATQADILIGLTQEAKLFHTADGAAFADVSISGHRETWAVRSRGFKGWLCKRFYEATGGAPNSEALQAALGVSEAVARFDGEEGAVFLRVGEAGGKVYIDLADAGWRAVEIDAAGWRVVTEPPVRFRRPAGMLALPEPVPGGSLDDLRSFVNVKSYDDFILAVAWLVAGLRARGPYPLLCIAGEQGSAKTTFSAIMRSLVDPNAAPLRTLPREDRDLFIAAMNGHVLAFDNLSGIPLATSDTMCRLATGGGFAVRALYTDSDETTFNGARPIVANGIDDFITRPDLADRSIFLTLSAIPEEARRLERDVWADFERAKPAIMGALFDAVAGGLRALPFTKLERLPRLADFAVWATACGSGLWPDGAFMTAYTANRKALVGTVIEGNPVAAAISELMAGRESWHGSYADLLEALGRIAGEPGIRSKSWPADTMALGKVLHRVVTPLREAGIELEFGRTEAKRTIAVSRGRLGRKISVIPVIAVIPEENQGVNHDSNHDSNGAPAVMKPAAVMPSVIAVMPTVMPKSLISKENDSNDSNDSKIPTQSGSGTGAAPLTVPDRPVTQALAPELVPEPAIKTPVTILPNGMRRIRL